jgi:hypothetical protein
MRGSPLLDNNKHLGQRAFLIASSRLSHTPPEGQSGLVRSGSNIFMKISGAAIVALNRGYGLGSAIFSLCLCQPS